MGKGTSQKRIVMAAVKAFLGAFIASVAAQHAAGTNVETAAGWKTIAISAVIAGVVAAWKVADICMESKG
jgi:hypothetical protein